MNYYKQKLSHLKSQYYSNEQQIASVIKTRQFIDDNFDKDLNLDILSKHRFTSKYHLHRLFKRYYGLTPRQYLTDRRIQKSKEYLVNGSSVTETCFMVGFESLGSFSKLFKSKTGIAPSMYKKEQDSRSSTVEEC